MFRSPDIIFKLKVIIGVLDTIKVRIDFLRRCRANVDFFLLKTLRGTKQLANVKFLMKTHQTGLALWPIRS